MERIKELLEKEVLTQDEFEELNEMEEVKNMENCGNSGRDVNLNWYNCILKNGEEYSIYTKSN